MGAVSSLDYETVEKTLKSGLLDPNFQHTECGKYTPLHCAVDSEIDWSLDNPNPDGKMVKLLLEYGANPNIVDRESRSPLDWAISTPPGIVHPKAYELLLQYGAKTGEELTGVRRKQFYRKSFLQSVMEDLGRLRKFINRIRAV